MKFTIRDYTKNDYVQCEELVNQAWNFDGVFQPKKLSAVAKKIYAKGSVKESTYRTVAEVNGEVVGFIFGINDNVYKPRLHLGLRLSILWNLLSIKSSTPDKSELIGAMGEHEKNRADFVGKRRSEIVLFVVGEPYQGEGIGKNLWAGFLKNCTDSNVSKVIVETNKNGASSFYEGIGFQHLADFYSPLHEFASPKGQACVYEYVCK